MTKERKKAFTLIEVLVSVMLIFIIGFTLTKISSQNINTLQKAKDNYVYLYSAVINSTHEYRDINDYIGIRDIPKYDLSVEKRKDELSTTSLELAENFIINYILEKESIKDDNQTKSFFRIK